MEGSWEERSSPAWAPDGDGPEWMKTTSDSADKLSSMGFFKLERHSGGRGSSQPSRLGRRGSDSGRQLKAFR
jgi:hypothetical protein